MCGGFFVSRVNFTKTKCSDGVLRDRRYVSELDFTAIALPPTRLARELEVGAPVGAAAAVLKATFEPKQYGSGVSSAILRVSEVWSAGSSNAPTGTFYKVTDRGIRCITAPCPSLRQAKLNAASSTNITGLELSASGLTATEQAKVFTALDEGMASSSPARTWLTQRPVRRPTEPTCALRPCFSCSSRRQATARPMPIAR